MVYHLRNNGVSYQLDRVNSWKEEEMLRFSEKRKVPEQTTIYRLDMNWLNCNKSIEVVKHGVLPGYMNYYLEVCPNGVHEVKTYNEIIYRNIYNRIDLHYYEKNGALKYDYLVAAGADYSQIQIEIKGAEKMSLNSKGDLIITTPLGNIVEQAPIVKQNGRTLRAKWVLKANVLSFHIQGADAGKQLIIDPVVRSWGTYYGGYNTIDATITRDCITDAAGNVYLAGSAPSSGTLIATTGSHQSGFGGNSNDAYLAKFNSAGVRQWGTFYGGSGFDGAASCATDVAGNVYMAGGSTSPNTGNVIATPGSHQTTLLGLANAILVKFNPSGVRIWGTYYGGSSPFGDSGSACATDAAGNIYLAGQATSFNSISTPGSYQPARGGVSVSAMDAFLVKFNSAGVRQWGTYYGGDGAFDYATACDLDASGNIYIAGCTSTTLSGVMATPGSFQPAPVGGNTDGFLAKFSPSGMRIWSTYYGGLAPYGEDEVYSCATDALGNIFISGTSTSLASFSIAPPPGSATLLASPGSHQPLPGGGPRDAYLAKFDSGGVRQWGTHYGIGSPRGTACTTDLAGNIYMAGCIMSTTGTIIATPGNHQPVYGGGVYDAYLVKFDPLGVRQWGTYYGGTAQDEGKSCTVGPAGKIYLAGQTQSTATAVIATANAHQTSLAGVGSPAVWNAFLVQFDECAQPTVSAVSSLSLLCAGQPATLTASGASTYVWNPGGTGASIVITPTITSSYTVTGTDTTGCYTSVIVTQSIIASPAVNIISNSSTLCSGQAATLTASGAGNYAWNPPATGATLVINPLVTTTYSVTGTDANGCYATAALTQTVITPQVSAVSNPTQICAGQTATLTASGVSTYTWNNAAAGNTLAVSPTITTTYTVTGTDVNGCSKTIFVAQVVSACVGVDDLTSGYLHYSLYPNPSMGMFTIELEAAMEFELVSPLGQVILSQTLNAGSNEINITGQAGLYLIRLKKEETTKTFKLIKE